MAMAVFLLTGMLVQPLTAYLARQLLKEKDVTTMPPEAEEICGCCEIGDYDPAPDTDSPDYNAAYVPGSCMNCDHSPEEHAAAF